MLLRSNVVPGLVKKLMTEKDPSKLDVSGLL